VLIKDHYIETYVSKYYSFYNVGHEIINLYAWVCRVSSMTGNHVGINNNAILQF